MTLPVAQRIPATSAYRLLRGESVQLAPTARQPVDYAGLLGDHRVLYCGENHWDLGAKADLTRALPALRRAGITHLGMEMFFSADREPETQQALDHYFDHQDGVALRTIRERLHYYGVQYACAPAYERLVITAMTNGIRVTGLNSNTSHRGLDNANWADTVSTLLSGSAETRVIVYGGLLHMGHHVWNADDRRDHPLVNTILAQRGVTGSVLHYVWDGCTNGGIGSQRAARIHATVASVGACDEQYLLAMSKPSAELHDCLRDSDDDTAWPDYLVHPAAPTHTHTDDEYTRAALLGLPDDAYWAQRWRTFHTQWWERYVDRDDPNVFDVGSR